MLAENIKRFRKAAGFSQETLAQELSVVRQTVSKWEKGLSVPDAEMLRRLAEVLEVPVSTLLADRVPDGEPRSESEMAEVAKQLAVLNEQMANRVVRHRKIFRRVLIGSLVAFVLIVVLWAALLYVNKFQPRQNAVLTTVEVECTLDGEIYGYEVTFDENRQIYYVGGDAFIASHVMTDRYDDPDVLLAQIEDYFVDRGGTFRVLE